MERTERVVLGIDVGGTKVCVGVVTEDGRVVITAGLADRFEEVKDSGYTYETVS